MGLMPFVLLEISDRMNTDKMSDNFLFSEQISIDNHLHQQMLDRYKNEIEDKRWRLLDIDKDT